MDRTDTSRFDPDRIRVVVFDADGVLVHGATFHPAALNTWHWVKSTGRTTYLLTNNSTTSRARYARRWQRRGFPIKRSEIVSSGYLAALLLRRVVDERAWPVLQSVDVPHFYIVGGTGIPAELRATRVAATWSRDPRDTRPAQVVIVGLDKNITYRKLARALRSLLYDDAVFVATNRDATYPTETGLWPGAGSIVASLVTASGREPDFVMGKPEPQALWFIRDLVGCRSDEMLIVGDRLETDILCARRAGVWSALVLSGVTSAERLAATHDPLLWPDFVLDDVGQLADLFRHPARFAYRHAHERAAVKK